MQRCVASKLDEEFEVVLAGSASNSGRACQFLSEANSVVNGLRQAKCYCNIQQIQLFSFAKYHITKFPVLIKL